MKGKIIIIAIYVDDITLISNDGELLKETKTMLQSKFEMTDMGQIHHILGLRIQYHKGEKISIDQAHYTEQILERFGMKNCRPISTPADQHTQLRISEENEILFDNMKYRSAVGALMYLTIATRPDIAFAINRVARFIEKPNNTH